MRIIPKMSFLMINLYILQSIIPQSLLNKTLNIRERSIVHFGEQTEPETQL